MSYTIEHRRQYRSNNGHLCIEAWFVRMNGKRVTIAYPSEAAAERARGVLAADDQRMARERKAAVRVVV